MCSSWGKDDTRDPREGKDGGANKKAILLINSKTKCKITKKKILSNIG